MCSRWMDYDDTKRDFFMKFDGLFNGLTLRKETMVIFICSLIEFAARWKNGGEMALNFLMNKSGEYIGYLV